MLSASHWPLPFAGTLNYRTYAFCFLSSLILAVLLTPWVMRVAVAFGAVDRPKNRKMHNKPTPLMGGLAVFLAMWVPLTGLCFYNNHVTIEVQRKAIPLTLTLIAGLVMVFAGMVDDRFGLRARQKLLCQIPIALALVYAGIRIDRFDLPVMGAVELGSLAVPVTVCFFLGVTNAMNLVDGLDGLAAGVAMFVSVTNAILATMNGSPLMAVLMWSMAGACLGFLRFNFHPAAVFLGDTGSLFLGATLAVSSILCHSKGAMVSSLFVPTVLVGYPVIDTLLAITRRTLKGKPIFSPDAGHIHHQLLAKGLSQTKAAISIYLVCVLLSLLALVLVIGEDRLVAAAMVTVTFLFIGGLKYLGYLSYFTSPTLRRDRKRFQASFYYGLMMKSKLGLAENPAAVRALVLEAVKGLQLRQVGGQAPASVCTGGTTLLVDDYTFANSGEHLRVVCDETAPGVTREMCMENRVLFGEIVEAANERLASLEPPRGAPAPWQQAGEEAK
jgi:UDP-GlcNAc:undecaprenyl-phosphate GlcNAc-1-phosphate transferase